jgi:molybdopterin molybdotransferase
LRPQHLIAAAGGDLDELEVFRRPCVQIVCCGDELVEPGQARISSDQIPESISVGVAALVRRFGGDIVGRTLLRDDLPAMSAALGAAVPKADAVVMIGGASVGEKDFAKAAFEALGLRRAFANVAMKPGKPVWLGELSGIPVLGLPGNPTSALVCARLLLAPLIAGLGGRGAATALTWRTVCCAGVERCVDRDLFIRAASSSGDTVQPLSNQDSAAQKALADADTLIRVRPGPLIEKSAEIMVEVVDF